MPLVESPHTDMPTKTKNILTQECQQGQTDVLTRAYQQGQTNILKQTCQQGK